MNALARLWAWLNSAQPVEMFEPDQRQAALAADAAEALAAVRALSRRVVKLEQLAGILGPDGWAVEKPDEPAFPFAPPHACENSMCFSMTHEQST